MRTTQRELREGNPTIDEMRDDIAEHYAMNMGVSEVMTLLLDGCIGLNETPDLEIRDDWEETFGELKNWETK
jgi:hypothetical protein